MLEDGMIRISVCQGPLQMVGSQLVRVGTHVIIDRPGKKPRYYENVGSDAFMMLVDLISRHKLRIYPWATMLGYTTFWDPKRGEVEGGDES